MVARVASCIYRRDWIWIILYGVRGIVVTFAKIRPLVPNRIDVCRIDLVEALRSYICYPAGDGICNLLFHRKVEGISYRNTKSIRIKGRVAGILIICQGEVICRWRLWRWKDIAARNIGIWIREVSQTCGSIGHIDGSHKWDGICKDIVEDPRQTCVIEHPSASTKTGPAIPKDVIGEAKPRHEVCIDRPHHVFHEARIA